MRVGLLLVLLAAFFLRVYNLDAAPPGLYYDEAAHGLDAVQVWQGRLHLFFPTANGHEPLFTYLVALFVRVLDNTILAVRLPAAMLGTVAVAAAFALGRRLIGEKAALLAAGLLAVTFWTVALSRMGYRANALPVLFPLWLLAFWRCRGRDDLAPYLLAGLLLGLSQYTYTAARFMPLLALVLALDWRKTLNRRGLLFGAGVAVLVMLPLVWAIVADLSVGGQRIRQAALWNRPEPWQLFWQQLRGHLRMFGLTGDPLWIHNIPFRSPLLLPVALLFWLGVAIGWRSPGPRALLWAVTVMLWPGILAVSNNPAPPDQLRIIEIAAPTFLLAGAGLLFLTRRRPGWMMPLVVALVLVDGGVSWRDYQQWSAARESYEQLDADMTRLAWQVVDNPDTFFLTPISAEWKEFAPGEHWTIDYLSGRRPNYFVIGPPYELPPYQLPGLHAEQVALVRWTAGMHVSADPQRALEGELALLGYTKTHEEAGRTFLLLHYTHTGADVTVHRFQPGHDYVGGLRINAVNLYHTATTGDQPGELLAEVQWESDGPYPAPISVSLRLLDETGATVAQVDSALWNDLGETADRWQTPEQSRLFLELGDPTLAPGGYRVILLVYATESLQPLTPIDPAQDGYIGRWDWEK